MKVFKLLAPLILVTGLSACDRNEVGDVSLGLFTTKDIKIEVLTDPVIPGVTCHISSIEADLDFRRSIRYVHCLPSDWSY